MAKVDTAAALHGYRSECNVMKGKFRHPVNNRATYTQTNWHKRESGKGNFFSISGKHCRSDVMVRVATLIVEEILITRRIRSDGCRWHTSKKRKKNLISALLFLLLCLAISIIWTGSAGIIMSFIRLETRIDTPFSPLKCQRKGGGGLEN